MTGSHVVELVKWRQNGAVSDSEMTGAVEDLLPDLQTIPGFVSQKLYKDDNGLWVDLYVWKTKEEAVASNDLMAPKPSFSRLMSLIELSSVSIEFLTLPRLQSDTAPDALRVKDVIQRSVLSHTPDF